MSLLTMETTNQSMVSSRQWLNNMKDTTSATPATWSLTAEGRKLGVRRSYSEDFRSTMNSSRLPAATAVLFKTIDDALDLVGAQSEDFLLEYDDVVLELHQEQPQEARTSTLAQNAEQATIYAEYRSELLTDDQGLLNRELNKFRESIEKGSSWPLLLDEEDDCFSDEDEEDEALSSDTDTDQEIELKEEQQPLGVTRRRKEPPSLLILSKQKKEPLSSSHRRELLKDDLGLLQRELARLRMQDDCDDYCSSDEESDDDDDGIYFTSLRGFE